MFEPNVLKLVIKTIFINSSPFAFLIINIKILVYNSLERMVHIWFKKRHLKKKKDYPLSRFECFEHAKTFFICVEL